MIVLKALLDLILFIIVGAGIPVLIIWSLWSWKDTLGSEKPWIKFKDFVKLYSADPGKWDIDYRDNPKLRTSADRDWPKTYVYFKFNYIDLYRYRLWKFNTERQKEKQKARQKYEEAMAALNVDMQQFNQENGVEIQLDGKDPRVKALAKDIVNYINEGRKGK